MSLKLATIDNVGKYWKVLIYGYMGSGKTHLAATAQDHPELQDTLFWNVEGGLKTVIKRGDIYYEDIKSAEKMNRSFYKLINKKDGYENIKTVVVDSVSEFQVCNLEEIVKNDKKKRADENQLTLRDYGISTKQLQKIFRQLRDAPFNVIFVSHPKEVFEKGGDEGDPPIFIQPQLTNQLSKSLMGYVDYCWYLETSERKVKSKKEPGKIIKKVVRKLYTRDTLAPNGVTMIRAKTRGSDFHKALGDIVEDPNLAEMYNLYLSTEGS